VAAPNPANGALFVDVTLVVVHFVPSRAMTALAATSALVLQAAAGALVHAILAVLLATTSHGVLFFWRSYPPVT
jgi:hypothetical protein